MDYGGAFKTRLKQIFHRPFIYNAMRVVNNLNALACCPTGTRYLLHPKLPPLTITVFNKTHYD